MMSTPSNSTDDLRVCIVAENASFRFGGEASLPLHYFSRLRARGIEAWLIIHSRTRAELEALFPNEQHRIQYIPDEWYHKLIWKLSRFLPRRVAEATLGTLMLLINQIIQRGMVRKTIREHRVTVVHQPIPVSPKAPSFLSGFGVPVVIGPMNGGMDFPAAFRGAESWFTRITVDIGRSSANLVNSIVSGKKHAAILLVANRRTRLALPNCVRGRVVEIPENGVDLKIWTRPVASSSISASKRFLFVGRLVDWKRLDLVIEAMAEIPGADLEVIGDGPMRPAWTALAAKLGIADRVHFIGWLPQPECAGASAECYRAAAAERLRVRRGGGARGHGHRCAGHRDGVGWAGRLP